MPSSGSRLSNSLFPGLAREVAFSTGSNSSSQLKLSALFKMERSQTAVPSRERPIWMGCPVRLLWADKRRFRSLAAFRRLGPAIEEIGPVPC